jgi:hypothetical protein
MQTKWCAKCDKDRLIDEFDPNLKRSDKLQTYCRECYSKYHGEWYKRNKEKVKKKTAIRNAHQRSVIVEFLFDYLSTHACVDCGFSDIRALDFDHVRGKKLLAVTELYRRRCSLDKLVAEVAKCEVRCRNCHGIRTNTNNLSWRNKHR